VCGSACVVQVSPETIRDTVPRSSSRARPRTQTSPLRPSRVRRKRSSLSGRAANYGSGVPNVGGAAVRRFFLPQDHRGMAPAPTLKASRDTCPSEPRLTGADSLRSARLSPSLPVPTRGIRRRRLGTLAAPVDSVVVGVVAVFVYRTGTIPFSGTHTSNPHSRSMNTTLSATSAERTVCLLSKRII